MDRLTIGAVSRLTSIPTHTLRKWESRHEIVQPLRSESGRRFYTEDHVARLTEVKALMAEGHALSELAKLDTSDLRTLRKGTKKTQTLSFVAHRHRGDTARREDKAKKRRLREAGTNFSHGR